MRNKLILILFLICSLANANTIKEDIKKQVVAEFDLLQTDLKNTYTKIDQLRIGKKNLEASLKYMEEWGLNEQKEKIEYYSDKIKAESLLQEEKTQHLVTKNKYSHLKKLAGYICAALFMFAYFSVLAPGVKELAPFLGHWGLLVRIGSPAFAAMLGYYSAQVFL
jgi:hypothetical protein